MGFLFCSLRNEVELSARMYAMVRRFLTFAHSANMHPDCDLIRRGRDKRERKQRDIEKNKHKFHQKISYVGD